MSIDPITEILARHADQLNSGQPADLDALLSTLPEKREELEPLMDIATLVKRTLKPVKPAPAFRERLHDGLIMAATHQQAHRILVDKRDESQWRWLLGVAAIGSAAGLIAMVWRSRAQEHKVTAGAAAEERPCAE